MEMTYKQTEPEKVIPEIVTVAKVIIVEVDLRNNVCLITSELNGKAWQEKYTIEKTDKQNAQAFIAGILGKKETVSDIKILSAEAVEAEAK